METWKPLPDWEGLYEVSDLGRVRSLQRKGTGSHWYRTYGGQIVKPFIASTGYLAVNLTKSGKRQQLLIHRAVLRAFRGEPAVGHQCCHENGNRSDARLANLRWDTVKGNMADKKRHGTQVYGWRNPRAKLDECLVAMLRRGEVTPEYVATNYGLALKYVRQIARHRNGWKHCT